MLYEVITHRLDARQQVLVGHGELEPGQVRSQAEVLPHAEAEVAVRIAIDAKLEA